MLHNAHTIKANTSRPRTAPAKNLPSLAAWHMYENPSNPKFSYDLTQDGAKYMICPRYVTGNGAKGWFSGYQLRVHGHAADQYQTQPTVDQDGGLCYTPATEYHRTAATAVTAARRAHAEHLRKLTHPDEQSQRHLLTLDGYTIRLARNYERDTTTHTSYKFTLYTPDGQTLYGRQIDTVGIPTRRHPEQRPSHEAALLAFSSATLQHSDTDESFFSDDTAAITVWRTSKSCEFLGYTVSDEQEKAGLN